MRYRGGIGSRDTLAGEGRDMLIRDGIRIKRRTLTGCQTPESFYDTFFTNSVIRLPNFN